MACDTFLKIVQKCKRKFVTTQVPFCPPKCTLHNVFVEHEASVFYQFIAASVECPDICFYDQVGENEPFVSELLNSLPTTIADLEPHQIHTFYESVCLFESRYMFCLLLI